MSSAIGQISDAGNALSHGDIVGAAGRTAGSIWDAPGFIDKNSQFSLVGHNDSSPGNPAGPNANLQSLHDQQVAQAQNFRQNLPQYQQQLGQSLQSGINHQLNAANQTTQAQNSARGMGYGGVNQGMLAANQGKAQLQSFQGTQAINSQLNNAADQMDMSAINSGAQIQGAQQQMQNNIYNQTMAEINANNSSFGSAAGFGLLAYLAL